MASKSSPAKIIATMVQMSILAGVILAGVLIPPSVFVTMTATAMADEITSSELELPDGAIPQSTKVLANDGTTLAYFYSQNRENVALNQVAPIMRAAILSIEDYRFYDHGPLDLQGTLRAAAKNAVGDTVQGGSTITQQLIKQILIQQAQSPAEIAEATETTLTRKARELKYAINYEQEHSKDQILEDYLNIAYFGDGAYGISAAARHFFSVEASELTLAQAALLAGLVKNPTGYDPTSDPDRALQRRNTVLDVMQANSEITQAEAAAAKAEPLNLNIQAFGNGCTTSMAAFSCDYVRRYLLADPSLGKTVKERRQKLEAGGYVIHTTFDPRMQKAANTAVKKNVNAKDPAIGVLAMIEPGTGYVKAVAQSRPMGADAKAGQTFLNFAVPEQYGDSGGFQAGSTFKIFTTVAALKVGISHKQAYNSPGTLVMPYGAYETCEGKKTQKWRVKNAGNSGRHSMYSGLRNSVNTYFAQLERDAGLCETIRTAQSMGITVGKNSQVPPFTLGIQEVSPLDLAAAYATVAAQGVYCVPLPVTKIEDQNGNVVKEYEPDCEQVVDANIANRVNDILRGVQEPGGFGGNRGLTLSVPSAAKTGTVQNQRAVWYAGYTPQLSTAAMIAGVNAKGEPITLVGKKIKGKSLGSAQAFGSSLAGPMWGDAMKKIDDILEPIEFVKPKNTD